MQHSRCVGPRADRPDDAVGIAATIAATIAVTITHINSGVAE